MVDCGEKAPLPLLAANGNEAIVLAAGFKLRNRNSRRSTAGLQKVSGQRAKPGRLPGEAILQYNRVPGAVIYATEWSADNGEHWHRGPYSYAREVARCFLSSDFLRAPEFVRDECCERRILLGQFVGEWCSGCHR